MYIGGVRDTRQQRDVLGGRVGVGAVRDGGAAGQRLDTLSVAANGSFTFATQLACGAAYSVTVQTDPSGQTCTVANGSGTVGSANVTNVASLRRLRRAVCAVTVIGFG